MRKTCSKCLQSFNCNANDINNCFCNSIAISPQILKQILQTYTNCLCEACLKELVSNNSITLNNNNE